MIGFCPYCRVSMITLKCGSCGTEFELSELKPLSIDNPEFFEKKKRKK